MKIMIPGSEKVFKIIMKNSRGVVSWIQRAAEFISDNILTIISKLWLIWKSTTKDINKCDMDVIFLI